MQEAIRCERRDAPTSASASLISVAVGAVEAQLPYVPSRLGMKQSNDAPPTIAAWASHTVQPFNKHVLNQ